MSFEFNFVNKETLFIFSLSQKTKLKIENQIKERQKPVFVTNKEITLNYDEWSEIVLFTGWLKNGVPIEKGKYTYDTGDLYEGEFYDDGTPRSGKIVYTNGDVFEGEFSNGEISKGMLKKSDGDVYSGTFMDEDIAYGKVSYADGCKYEGEFSNWLPQGHGTFERNDGRSYTGELYGGVPHGKGVFIDWNKNLIITGEFFLGKPIGKYQIKILDNKKEKK